MRFCQNGLEERTEEFLALWSAPNADALHRVLVLEQAHGRSADAFEPFALLQRHHEAEPEASVATASLLLTDVRWRSGVGNLVRRIVASPILGQEELDLLARTFLAAEKAVFWEVPDDWFGDEEIVIRLDDEDVDLEPDDLKPDDAPASVGRTLAKRHVAPPLRRWAAEHVVSQDPGSWGGVFARARELDPRGGAAVMAGLLDAIEMLVPAAQALLVKAATTWPNPAVRLAALELVARRHGVEAARQLAGQDASARVRAWFDTTAGRNVETAGRPALSGGGGRVGKRVAARSEPPTLF